MFRKLKTKKGLTVAIMLLSTLVIGLSYGSFVLMSSKYKASELLISNLMYGITIVEDGTSISNIQNNKVTIPSGSKAYFNVTVSSVNEIDSKYTLAYKASNNATVKYTDKTSWVSNGVIKGYDENTYNKTIRVIIDNTSESSSTTVEFQVYGGYTFNSFESIALTNGYYTVGGPYSEVARVEGTSLTSIIESDTKCTTQTNCMYAGGSLNNYIQYPENTDKTKNLWRIIGTYKIDERVVTKIIKEDVTSTTQANITNELTTIYNTLDNQDTTIYKTDKFNCTSDSCTASTITSKNLGLLTSYEYEALGGENSYLGTNIFLINNTSVVKANGSNIEETSSNTTSNLKPVAYLQDDTKVTGKGTKSEPYVISPKGDINLISYTYKGKPTTMTYNELVKSKYVQSITCQNGTKATWDGTMKIIKLGEVKTPDNCTIDFGDEIPNNLYNILTNGVKYAIDTRTNFSSVVGGETLVVGYNSTGKIYVTSKASENETGVEGDKIYYFAGNPSDNWVKFAGYYWRIIRTDATHGVKLLYAGNTPSTTDVAAKLTNAKWDSMGIYEEGTFEYEKSILKTGLEIWYENSVGSKYDTLISTTAKYCNDTSYTTDVSDSDNKREYGTYTRLITNKTPTYKCPQEKDNLSIKAGLITGDELAFAGGVWGKSAPNTYYYRNSANDSVNAYIYWSTFSPLRVTSQNYSYVMNVFGKAQLGKFGEITTNNAMSIRPVITLSSKALISGGTGIATDPYTIEGTAD